MAQPSFQTDGQSQFGDEGVQIACDRYRREWRSGLSIEDILSDSDPSLRTEILAALIQLDLELREEAGDKTSRETYHLRFPDDSELIDRVFNAARIRDTPAAASSTSLHARSQDRDTDLTPPAISIAHTSPHGEQTKPDDQDRLAGTSFGRFQLREILGEGGFGSVYRAHDPSLDREVAVKIPRAALVETEQHVQRFLREARSAAQLRHPHLVPVYEAGKIDGRYFIASAFIPGVTLRERIKKTQLPIDDAVTFVRKLADGLDYAHRKGIIHRDIKPDNVLIDDAGEPLLADFGLARQQNGDVLLTHEGLLMGTPAYMSPEQAKGESHLADSRSDIWSLGIVLYELLTGQRPFQGNTVELLVAIKEKGPESPRRINPAVSRDLAVICLKCLEKDREQRYATARDLKDDLARWQRGEPIRARRIGVVERSLRWCRGNPVAVGVVTLLCLLTTAAVYFAVDADYQRSRAVAESIAKGKESARAQENQLAADKAHTLSERETAFILLSQANTLSSARRPVAALDLYEQVRQRFRDLGLSTFPSDFGQWRLSPQISHALQTVKLQDFGSVMAFDDTGNLLLVSESDLSIWDSTRGTLALRLQTPAVDVQAKIHRLRSVFGTDFNDVTRIQLPGEEIPVTSTPNSANVPDALNANPVGRVIMGRFVEGSSKVVACTVRGFVVRWDASSRKLDRVVSLGDFALSADIAPDGQQLLMGGGAIERGKLTPRLTLFDLNKWETIRTFPWTVNSIAFAPDGEQACMGGAISANGVSYHGAQTFRLSDGQRQGWLGATDHLFDVAFAPNGDRILVVGSKIQLWDGHSESPLEFISNIHGPALQGAILPSGSSAIVAQHDGLLQLWDTGTQSPRRAFLAPDGSFDSMALSSDGAKLAACGSTKKRFRLWPTQADTGIRRFQVRVDDAGHAHGFSDDEKLAFAIVHGSGLNVFDVATGIQLQTIPVSSLCRFVVSADGRRVCRIDKDGTTIWDVSTGRRLSTIPSFVLNTKRGNRDFCALSANGRTLRAIDTTGRILRWNTATGRIIGEYRISNYDEENDDYSNFARDGAILVAKCRENGKSVFTIWDLEKRKKIVSGTWIGHFVGMPRSGHRGIWSDGRVLQIVDLKSGGVEHELELPVQGSGEHLQDLDIAPDGSWFMAITNTFVARFWSLETGREFYSTSARVEPVHSASISPGGDKLLMFVGDASNRELQLWDIGRVQRQREFEERLPQVRARLSQDRNSPVALASLGRWYAFRQQWREAIGLLMAARSHGAEVSPIEIAHCLVLRNDQLQGDLERARDELRETLDEFEPASYAEMFRQAIPDTPLAQYDAEKRQGIHDVALVEQGRRILGGTGVIEVINSETTGKLFDIQAPGATQKTPAHLFCVSKDERFLAAVDRNDSSNGLKLIELQTGKTIASFTGHSGPIHAVTISGDGTWVGSASADGSCRVWNAESGEQFVSFEEHDGPVEGIALAPDDSTVASCSRDSTCRLWSRVDGKQLWKVDLPAEGTAVAFSPNGNWIYLGCKTGVVQQLDAKSGEVLKTLTGFDRQITKLVLSPDGGYLAVAGKRNDLWLWDLKTDPPNPRRFHGHVALATSAAFSPNGASLWSSSLDGTIREWPLSDERSAAEKVLKLGGSLRIRIWGKTKAIRGIGDLPSSAFKIVNVELRDNSNVDDTLFDELSVCRGLSHLDLRGSKIDDASLAGLEQFTSLRHLNLADTMVTDAIGPQLGKLSELQHLDLRHTSIGDGLLVHLGKINSLQQLDLGGTRVSDGGLASLSGLNQLRYLGLENTSLTDNGLSHVVRIRTLNHIATAGSRVTESRVKNLVAARWVLDSGGQIYVLLNGQVKQIPVRSFDMLPKEPFQVTYIRLWQKPISSDDLAVLDGLEMLGLVDLGGTRLSDDGLRHLANCQEMRELWIAATGVSDQGMEHVAKMRQLRRLVMYNTHIGDHGLARLKELKYLEEINLSDTNVTDDGLFHLAEMKNLKKLLVSGSKITDAGLKHLAGLTRMESLYVDRNQIDGSGLSYLNGVPLKELWIGMNPLDESQLVHLSLFPDLRSLCAGGAPRRRSPLSDVALRHIADCRSLKVLDVRYANITGSELRELAKLPRLTHLRLDGTKVSDQTIGTLAEFPALQEVNLKGTRATLPAIRALRKKMPDRKVVR